MTKGGETSCMPEHLGCQKFGFSSIMDNKNESKCFKNWATPLVKIFFNPGEGGVKFFAVLENIAPYMGDNLKKVPSTFP